MERREVLKKTAIIAGSAALAPSLLSILQSCQKQSRLNWKPVFLNDDQAQLISVLVDTLLPKTETPGALELKVDVFIDRVFADLYDENSQAGVVSEIENFDQGCKETFGNSFVTLNNEDRVVFLKSAESAAGTYNDKVWGTAVGKQEPVGFYRSLKSLALWAYFTTEQIGKNVLSYDPIPGDYLGCIPLSDVGNSWSL